MKFIKLILLVNLFVVFVSSSASAKNIEYPNSLALRKLLVNKDYEKLNDKITTYQKHYEENIINEIAFDLAFRAFNVANPTYEALFEEWIKQSPTSFVPYLARAYYLKAMGWHIRGGSLESRSTPYDIKDVRHYHLLALKDIDKAISLNPEITIIYAEKISLAKSLGAKKLKNEALNTGLDINPASYEIRKAYLYSIHPHQGGSSEQISVFLADTKKHEDSNRNLIPLAGFLDFVSGHLKNDRDKYKEAKRLVNKALEYGEKVWYYYERGISHYYLKEYDQSIADHTRALDLYPEYIDSLLWRSWAYRKKEMYAEALGDLDFAAELDPYNFKIIKNRAYVLTRFNQYDEAVEDYKRAVMLDSNDAKTWYYLGWYSGYKLKDYPTSIDAYKRAVDLSPNDASYTYDYAVMLNNMRDCNMGPVFKKYLKLCKGKKSGSCSKDRTSWADEMVKFIANGDACPG